LPIVTSLGGGEIVKVTWEGTPQRGGNPSKTMSRLCHVAKRRHRAAAEKKKTTKKILRGNIYETQAGNPFCGEQFKKTDRAVRTSVFLLEKIVINFKRQCGEEKKGFNKIGPLMALKEVP